MNTKQSVNINGVARRMINGITGSFLATVAATAIFAVFISKELIAEETIDSCSTVVLLVSAITGSSIAITKSDKKTLIGIYVGTAYLAVLMIITGIFFGAQYQMIGVTSLIVLFGCIFTAILRKNDGKNRRFRKSKIKRC